MTLPSLDMMIVESLILNKLKYKIKKSFRKVMFGVDNF